MIVDSLDNCGLYENLHKDFPSVFEVLKQIANGKVIEKTVLVPDCVWVNAPAEITDASAQNVFEAHRRFIDIHYIVSGAEIFGYSNTNCLTTVKKYDETDDYELLDGDKQFITLKTGIFCIVFPQDAHIPVCRITGKDKLIRVVAKIKI